MDGLGSRRERVRWHGWCVTARYLRVSRSPRRSAARSLGPAGQEGLRGCSSAPPHAVGAHDRDAIRHRRRLSDRRPAVIAVDAAAVPDRASAARLAGPCSRPRPAHSSDGGLRRAIDWRSRGDRPGRAGRRLPHRRADRRRHADRQPRRPLPAGCGGAGTGRRGVLRGHTPHRAAARPLGPSGLPAALGARSQRERAGRPRCSSCSTVAAGSRSSATPARRRCPTRGSA